MFERNAPRTAVIVCGLAAIGLLLLAWWLGLGGRDAISDRVDAGKRPRPIDHARTATWWAAVLGAGLFVLATLTAHWWAKVGASGALFPATSVSTSSPTWRWWVVAGGLLLVATGLRVERMDLGLYNDESFMFRRYVAGEFTEIPATNETPFRQPDWATTLWHMEVGNNSPPYSALARIAYEREFLRSDLAPAQVDEAAIRLPAVIASLVGLLALGWLAYRLGSPDRGLLVMGIGAVHPWMVRYGSDARGHSLLLLWIPLLLWALLAAMGTGRWRHWLAVGGLSALALWTFPGVLYWLLAINAIIFIAIGLTWLRQPERRELVQRQLVRWLAANGAGAIAFWLLFAPSFNQLRATLGEVPALKGGPSFSWLAEVLALTGLGIPWSDHNPASEVALSVSRDLAPGNFWIPALGVLFGGVLILGIWRGWAKSPLATAVLLALGMLAPLLAFFVARATDTVLHSWYAISALPAILLLIGWGVPRLSRSGDSVGVRTGKIVGIATLLFLGWTLAIAPQLKAITRNSHQPIREAVVLVRGDVYPHYQDHRDQVRHASFWTDVTRYDPHIDTTWTVEELQEVEQIARSEGKPLFVSFGHRDVALRSQEKLVRYLEDSGHYEHVADLHGTDHRQFNYHVHRWLDPKEEPSLPESAKPVR